MSCDGVMILKDSRGSKRTGGASVVHGDENDKEVGKLVAESTVGSFDECIVVKGARKLNNENHPTKIREEKKEIKK